MQGHRQNKSYALKAVIRSQNPVQIFSEDARGHPVRPWQQGPGTAAAWGGFGGGSRGDAAAALPGPAQQPLLQHRGAASEIERGLAAEIREAALLRRGELWAEHRNAEHSQSRAKGAPSSPLDGTLAPCPG